MELSKTEQFVLDVFNTHGTAMKATELAGLCAKQANLSETTSNGLVEAIYGLIQKFKIIEIEYPDSETPDRLKSFLLPKTTDGLRINGVEVYAYSPTSRGFAIDFKPLRHLPKSSRNRM